jgi:hypothetical protein
MWNIFVNVLCIIAAYSWDWITGEADIVYPHKP